MATTIYEEKDTDYLVYSPDSYRYIVRRVVGTLSPKGKYRILELGCGSGAFSRYFLEDSECELVGVDVSAKLLSTARTVVSRAGFGGRAEFVSDKISVATLEALNLPSFDIVFSGAFLHHLAARDRSAILKYIAVQLRPGGVYAAFEPNLLNPAIRVQYLYETFLNENNYDKGEAPLAPSDVRVFSKTEVEYLDVEYRAVSGPESRVRYGVVGRFLRGVGIYIFDRIYLRLKRWPISEKFRKDYFLLLSSKTPGENK
jgi:SAM-dependent methyltransferase